MAMNLKQTIVRLSRILFAFCFSALLVFSAISPATAAVKSDPRQGEANLTGIERKSQEAAMSDPYDINKTTTETSKGINEVQGDADKDKMYNPSNTKAKTFESQFKDAVEKVTGDE